MPLELWDFTEIVSVIVNTCSSTWQPNSRPADFKFNVEKNWGMNEGLVRCKLLDPAPKGSDLVSLGGGLKAFPLNGYLRYFCSQRRLSFPSKLQPFSSYRICLQPPK